MQSLDTEPCVDKTPDALETVWCHASWDSRAWWHRAGWRWWAVAEDWRLWLCLDWGAWLMFCLPRLTWEWRTQAPGVRVSPAPEPPRSHHLGHQSSPAAGEAGSVTTLWEREDVAECYCSEVIFFSRCCVKIGIDIRCDCVQAATNFSSVDVICINFTWEQMSRAVGRSKNLRGGQRK